MEQLVTSEFKLGIIAGGQLGKMLALAASNWDVKTYILDPSPSCPAATICTHFVQGDYTDYDTVVAFGQLVDMITLEIEHVNVAALRTLKQAGKQVHPDPEALAIIQDKGKQKQFYRQHHIPTAAFQYFENNTEIKAAIQKGDITLPFVQKSRTAGYDGKGVAVIKSPEDLPLLLNGPAITEEAISIQKELSVIVARSTKGETACFPPVEMEFNPAANLVEQLLCPASISPEVATKAEALAIKVIEHLGISGILAVEMFLTPEELLLVNEVAPRAHNSGHHTIESTITSQYEQHLRAIFGFPLGSTQLKLPSVMINLLGAPGHHGEVKYEGLTESMALEGVKIHVYGKKETQPYRKMGHATIMAPTIEAAKRNASIVKHQLKVIAWNHQK